MYKKKTVIINKTGLHARPAADFVKEAKKFSADITIKRAGGEDAANAKSIFRLLGLCLEQFAEVEISAEGTDEKQAVDSLAALIDSGFGET